MSEPSKEPNRSLSWRPLLSSSSGPRRIVKSYPDGETQEHGFAKQLAPTSNRLDKAQTSLKRQHTAASTIGYGGEGNAQSSPAQRISEYSEYLPRRRSSLEKDSQRLSVLSSRSSGSLSDTGGSLMTTQNNSRESLLPKNLQNVIYINKKPYIQLNKINSGGSSTVFQVLNEQNEVLALKCVDLKNATTEQYTSFVNEVKLLETLRGSPGIIYLVDYELDRTENVLKILMECGETDLLSYLNNIMKQNQQIDVTVIRLIWEQMLTAVNVIHHHNIIHRDLKPGNFLFVKGNLKLIDFGIAQRIAADATSVLKEHRFGTMNYISPETLMISDSKETENVRIRRSSDVWSLGVILYQMVYNHIPWSNMENDKKYFAIVSESYKIPFPSIANPWLLDSIKSCLQRKPELRPSIDGENGLLEHPFLQPQGPRAMKLYKQMALNNSTMKEVIRQIHEHAADSRWTEELIPYVTQELVIQCANNKQINVEVALEKAIAKKKV